MNNLLWRATWMSIGCLAVSCGSGDKIPDKPRNLVFILADDLGWKQSSVYGSEYYQTPNLERLASEGMMFTQAYAASSVSSPTRASIMTGKYPARLRITNYIPGGFPHDLVLLEPDWQKYLPLEEKTLGEYFKDYDFSTGFFGKWHLSKQKRPPGSLSHNPDKQGFDEYFITYKPGGDTDPEHDAHNVDSITEASVDFIERHRKEPFCLFIAHNSIHDPLMERQSAINQYKQQEASREPENNPVIAAMIRRLDRGIGRVLDAIEESGLNRETLVIFFSDNGGLEIHADQTPLRAGKGWIYEGGIRVPLIVRWPGRIPEGSVTPSMVSSIDMLPTILDLFGFGQEKGPVDGISFANVLLDKGELQRNTLYWHFPHYHRGFPGGAIRCGDYKLIERYPLSLSGKEGAFELYDLVEDISESNDLSEKMPGKTKELKEMLENWRIRTGARMPALNPDYQDEPEER